MAAAMVSASDGINRREGEVFSINKNELSDTKPSAKNVLRS
jgi:hypothetical protein